MRGARRASPGLFKLGPHVCSTWDFIDLNDLT
jgi:hypothetical protein